MIQLDILLLHCSCRHGARLCVRTPPELCLCEHVLFVRVLTVIPTRLSDSCSFITLLLVTREAEQTTLLFWETRCAWRNADSWPSHSQPAIAILAVRARFKFAPWTIFWPRVCVPFFVYLLLFVHQSQGNIIWHLLYLRMCTCCLFRRRIELSSRCLSRSILFIDVVCTARSVFSNN